MPPHFVGVVVVTVVVVEVVVGAENEQKLEANQQQLNDLRKQLLEAIILLRHLVETLTDRTQNRVCGRN